MLRNRRKSLHNLIVLTNGDLSTDGMLINVVKILVIILHCNII
jgi:hypothetical protein